MMALTWSARRKFIYACIALIFLVGAALLGYYKFIYSAPTCFDGSRNGGEDGVDCGGACQQLCTKDNLPPLIDWTRAFEVRTGTYSLFSVVENPNLGSSIYNASYEFEVFGADSKSLTVVRGSTNIPAGSQIGVFAGPVTLTEKPSRVEFRFGDDMVYVKGMPPYVLTVSNIALVSDNPPRVDVTISNNSVRAAGRAEIAVIVNGDDNNAVAVSRSFIEGMAPESSQKVSFTWPKKFETLERACEANTRTIFVIDRSGSMDDDGATPPQPLTAVLNAAKAYVDEIGSNARIGVVSFATEASRQGEMGLSSDKEVVRKAVDSVRIGTNGIQNTNIAAGLQLAADMILFSAHDNAPFVADAPDRTVVILLTDGEASHPKNPVNEDDEEYPRQAAIAAAIALKSIEGVSVYAIGLGSKLDGGLLSSIASDAGKYFQAADVGKVAGIYDSIASAICKKTPVIDVLIRSEE